MISKKEVGNRILIDIHVDRIIEAKEQLDLLNTYMEDESFNDSKEVANCYHTIWDACDDVLRLFKEIRK